MWEKVKQQRLFDFGDVNFEKHANVVSSANKISLCCLYNIIRQIITVNKLPLKESIFKYVDLRNGYLHKYNISQWSKIDEIREATYNMLFLLIGSQALSSNDLITLKIADYDIFTDYYRLCEYLNYHSNEFFYVKINDEYEGFFISLNDCQMDVSEDNYVTYSGIYFGNLGSKGYKYRFSEGNLPQQIFSAKFDFGNKETINLMLVKGNRIFENGKFLGSNIAADDEFDY